MILLRIEIEESKKELESTKGVVQNKVKDIKNLDAEKNELKQENMKLKLSASTVDIGNQIAKKVTENKNNEKIKLLSQENQSLKSSAIETMKELNVVKRELAKNKENRE